jgi:dolichol-phosphate mannosyltransferase
VPHLPQVPRRPGPQTEHLNLGPLTGMHRGPLVKFGKFAAVGATGAIVNTAVFILLYQQVHVPLIAASAAAVEISIIYNFVWNDRWTFARRAWSFDRFMKFNGVAVGGLIITTTTLWALVTHAHVRYVWANLAGIGLGLTWNFTVNSVWTWGVRHGGQA